MLYEHFRKVTNACFGIFKNEINELTPLNAPLLNMFNVDQMIVDVLHRTDVLIHGSWKNIPVKLIVIDDNGSGGVLVEVLFAQTKTSNYVTDFTRLAELATDGFWEWYPILNYEYMSSRFWSILGYDQKDMEESPSSWIDSIDEEDGKIAMQMFENHCKSKGEVAYYVKVKYRHKEGKDVHIVCRGSVIEWLGDKPWRVIGSHTDVTAIVIKDALLSREQFVSRMSHEIRSPLCAVINECDLLEDKYDLSTIKDSCKQILYIANDVLNLQKIKAGEMTVNLEKCDPEEVLNKALKRHRTELKKKGLRISSSVEDLPGEILLDVPKFNQIIDNLISNAIKYTNTGRVSVECDFDSTTNNLKVSIQDTGIGIGKDDKLHVFEEFFQGSSSMRGIGIGLHIVKELCAFLGGDVILEDSENGKGSTFSFHIPVEVVAGQQDTHLMKTLRVLVVDDMNMNRQYMNRKLKTLEMMADIRVSEIVEAVDGLDAVQKFQKSQDPFDVVMMDCLMPIMDGFSATRKIHDICDKKGIPRVPVIAVTASIAETLEDDCNAAGMICVVTKPYDSEDLINSINRAIDYFKR